MRAGISTLQEAGLLSTVVQQGVDLDFAVLADHQAGEDSLFLYPWCSQDVG
jgi:hypothetical protein